jgi:hypothetical protein
MHFTANRQAIEALPAGGQEEAAFAFVARFDIGGATAVCSTDCEQMRLYPRPSSKIVSSRQSNTLPRKPMIDGGPPIAHDPTTISDVAAGYAS